MTDHSLAESLHLMRASFAGLDGDWPIGILDDADMHDGPRCYRSELSAICFKTTTGSCPASE
jgi:hypothetical protein